MLRVATFILFALILYLSLVHPRIRDLSAKEKTLANQRQVLKAQREMIANLALVTERFQKAQAHLDIIKEKIFRKEEVTSFLKEVSGMVSQTGNKLVSLSPGNYQELGAQPGKEEKKERIILEKLPVRIEVRGDYRALTNLFQRLEENKRLLTVEGINIRPSSPHSSIIETNFLLNLYFFGKKEKEEKR